MKRFLSVLMAIVLAVSVLVIAPESAQAATMSISETSRTITEKEQFRLYINHCTSKVAWGSKDKSVAKVSTKGIVTGVRAGSTTILAKVGKTTYKCKVTVIPAMSKELTALARRFSYHYSSDHYVNADKITIRSIARGSYAFGQDTINIASYDYKIVSDLVRAAKEKKLDFAVDVYPHYGSDVDAALKAGYDIRHGLIGPGVYASHGYERSHRKGAENTLKLLMAYLG